MDDLNFSYNLNFNGKVALVTGATKGLGYGIAMGLAELGADVVVVSRNMDACEKVANEIKAKGHRCLASPADISQIGSIEKMVSKTINEMGKIDILVNDAGTAVTKAAIDITEEDWDHVVDLNLKGAFFLSQMVGKHMINQRRGKIINIASTMGMVGDVSILPYCASKGGVIQLTKALALEWAPYNIQVNCVCPGYVKTHMNERELNEPKIMNRMLRRIPMRRLGQVEEIVGAVMYLASEVSNYATGSALVVDGGWTCQ